MRHIRIYVATFAAFTLTLSLLLPGRGSAQQNVAIPQVIGEAFVLEYDEPGQRLLVDAGETNFSTNEVTEIRLDAGTIFVDRRNKPTEAKALRPGMSLEIRGERVAGAMTARLIKIQTNVEKWEANFEGYFERLEGNVAWVDGQRVALEPGAAVKGAAGWKGKAFNSFGEMMLGSVVKGSGVRRADGIVYARKVETKPNIFTDGDRKVRSAVDQGLAVPQLKQLPDGKVTQLSGGVVKIANQQFKLVEDLDMQTYVNLVGNKVVPRYVKDLARDDPARPLFRFYLIEDETFNAFAFPDGSVFIHTGLLKMLKNEAQLAAVLGHEVAHVTNEHARKSNESKLVMAGKVLGAVGVETKGTLVEMGLGLFANKFGREMEAQADRVGLMYMYEAGYDPREAPKVWRELTKLVKENAVANFIYSDHPTAKARLKNLNREITFNYFKVDFAGTLTNEERFRNTVGAFFGWIPRPKPPQAVPTASPAAAPAVQAGPRPKPAPGRSAPIKGKGGRKRP
jgi:hypothetical protein